MRFPTLDVFREDDQEQPLWVHARESMYEARQFVFKQSAESPGKYFVLDQRTGTKASIPSMKNSQKLEADLSHFAQTYAPL